MNRNKVMTQDKRSKFTAGTLVLYAAALICGLSIAAAVFWGRHGNTNQADSAAVSPAATDPVTLLEQRVQANPADATSLAALATAYFDAGRYGDSAKTYEKATVIEPGKASLWSALAEARVMASEHDPMPAAAAADFQRALSIDPKDPRARYFQAVKLDLDGKHQAAIDAWLALLADSPADAPWEPDLRRTIEQVGKINHIEVAARMAKLRQPAPAAADPHAMLPGGGTSPAMTSPAIAGIPGPTAEQLRAASSIPPSQQNVMVEGMVARLEGRLKTSPGDPDGWLMLMRSRMTMGQPDKARQALADALKANPGQADRIRREAAVLGVK